MTTLTSRRSAQRSPLALAAVLALLLGSLLLTACNTAAGFGRDVESAGNWIEENADDE